MSNISEKIRGALPLLKQHGEVYLCALFEREDLPEKWDILLSSDWSDTDAPEMIKAVSQALIPTLSPDELTSLSRIIAIPSSEPAITAITTSIKVTGGAANVENSNFMGLQIKKAIILHSEKPTKSEPAGLVK